jgi:hypothetical protein
MAATSICLRAEWQAPTPIAGASTTERPHTSALNHSAPALHHTLALNRLQPHNTDLNAALWAPTKAANSAWHPQALTCWQARVHGPLKHTPWLCSKA